MVTLEQTTRDVYATQKKTSNQETSESGESGTGKQEKNDSDETTYLLVKDENGSEKTVQVTEIQPVVKGVVVVCDGGGTPKVQQDITDAVTTALHITSVRVCVIKAK
jgi:stage III sporulation protein AG